MFETNYDYTPTKSMSKATEERFRNGLRQVFPLLDCGTTVPVTREHRVILERAEKALRDMDKKCTCD